MDFGVGPGEWQAWSGTPAASFDDLDGRWAKMERCRDWLWPGHSASDKNGHELPGWTSSTWLASEALLPAGNHGSMEMETEPPPPTRIRPRLADLAKSPMTTSLRISGDSRASESSCTTVDSVDQDAAAEAAEAAALEHHDRSTLHELTAVWVETANVPRSVVAVPRDNRMPRAQKAISRTRQPRHTHETGRFR
jgi:hypothetical protein